MQLYTQTKNQISDYLWKKIVTNQTSITTEAFVLLLYFKLYFSTYTFLQKSEKWSKNQLEQYQIEQLQKLINHAYENVPYYTTLFNKHNIKPQDITEIRDLRKIPLLTKEQIRNNLEKFKATNYSDGKFAQISTGGSSGLPLEIYEEKIFSYVKESAYEKILLNRTKCHYTSRFIYLRGSLIASLEDRKIWKYSLFHRCLLLSSFHMNEENLPIYIEKIRKFKPKFISAYPSALTILALYMKHHNIAYFPSLKTLICGAETLYDWQRTLLENVFHCRVFDCYGHAEQAIFSGNCEYSNYHHVFPQYGILELLDSKGNPVIVEGAKGEIVVTGFKNYIFPLIRYKTGDIGVYTALKCQCGREYPLLKRIEGRVQDFIINKDNSPISIAAINTSSPVFNNVHQFQFYQDKNTELIIRIVRREGYSSTDTENILKTMYTKLGHDIKITIQFVDSIPRTPAGKHKMLIQKIPFEKAGLTTEYNQQDKNE